MNACIGIGANLGDSALAVITAIGHIARLPETRVLAASRLYRSAPIEASGPEYHNAVVRIATGLDAFSLLAALQAIENGAGRERPYRHAPRTLDLDLLLYGEGRIDAPPRLHVPHPRMTQRAFVLYPLLEVDPDATIPGAGPAARWLASVAEQGLEPVARSPNENPCP